MKYLLGNRIFMLSITPFLILLYCYCEKAELFSLLCNSSIHVASGQRYHILTEFG